MFPLRSPSFLPSLPLNPAVRFEAWPWTHPFPAILSFCGWTIDDIVSSRHAAATVRVLWRVHCTAQRLRSAIEAENALQEQLWWRQQGCPVPCPICAATAECGCAATRLRPVREDWLPGGGDVWG